MVTYMLLNVKYVSRYCFRDEMFAIAGHVKRRASNHAADRVDIALGNRCVQIPLEQVSGKLNRCRANSERQVPSSVARSFTMA